MGLQKQYSKQLQDFQLVQKLRDHSQHVDANFQKAERMELNRKTNKQKMIYDGLRNQ